MKPIDLHLLNAEAKFKEAINHSFDLGWEASEERIIKLLEEQKAIECKKAVCGTTFDGHDYECLSEVIDCYIALIKGEK